MKNQSKKQSLFTLTAQIGTRTESLFLTPRQVARLVSVTEKTAKRWIDKEQTPHPHTLELLKIRAFGLPADPAFTGCHFKRGLLITTEGQELTPKDLERFVWIRGLYYRGIKDNEQVRKKLEELTEQNQTLQRPSSKP